ncbi:zf-HC2 domain-containing protein [Rhodospirillum sp. A1_3_36]|uniref:zf-HC2 domain-containing protein n=1 Tax=Rhodospirillum sp. A1_3_36 TaxID=3391666 RepID=UPI0039A62B77
MPETHSSLSDNTHAIVWGLIPWYVNGTLSPEEHETVKRHIETCPDCAAEVTRQRCLAQHVATENVSEEAMVRSWAKLSDQIKADERVRTPQPDRFRWFGGVRGGLSLAGAVAAACLVLVVFREPVETGFRTLTSPSTTAGDTIKFQTTPDLPPDRLKALLTEHGLTLVAGPSQSGVYTARIGADRNPKAAAEAFMALPEILFAAPEE